MKHKSGRMYAPGVEGRRNMGKPVIFAGEERAAGRWDGCGFGAVGWSEESGPGNFT
ncbi:MAG: hypothetical protein ABIA59_04000 [Candidatus Latescibacterota bacterium]